MARRTIVEVVKEAPKKPEPVKGEEPKKERAREMNAKKAERVATAADHAERLDEKKKESKATEEIRAQLIVRVRALGWMAASSEDFAASLRDLSRPRIDTIGVEIRDVLSAINVAIAKAGGGLLAETAAMQLDVLERKWSVARENARRIEAAYAKAKAAAVAGDPEGC